MQNQIILNIYKEIEKEYYDIIIKKDITDHDVIISEENNIISWNIENDVGYMTVYKFDNKQNYLEKFSEHLREHINNIFGIGNNFRICMEKSSIYKE